MKKKYLLFLSLILVSCGVSSVKNPQEKPLFEVLSQQTYGGASIRSFEILSKPDEIAILEKNENLKGKIGENDSETSNFIILNMGEKTSGGYAIGVESVVETAKNIIVTVKETSPGPDSMMTMALTNPFCVIRINSKKEIIIK